MNVQMTPNGIPVAATAAEVAATKKKEQGREMKSGFTSRRQHRARLHRFVDLVNHEVHTGRSITPGATKPGSLMRPSSLLRQPGFDRLLFEVWLEDVKRSDRWTSKPRTPPSRVHESGCCRRGVCHPATDSRGEIMDPRGWATVLEVLNDAPKTGVGEVELKITQLDMYATLGGNYSPRNQCRTKGRVGPDRQLPQA